MFSLEKILNKIVKYGLYAILLTPLVFWTKILYPFLTPKFILFQVLVEIVFGAWLILVILNRQYRPKFSWILISLLVFTSISLISAILGIDFQRSFWGIGARMTGLFAELHFLAWFLMLFTAFSNTNTRMDTNDTNNKNIRDIRMPLINSYYYLNFSFFVSLIVAITAFFQNPAWSMAIGSTIFNNPTFVAPYFIFHFFWGLYQTFASSLNNTNTRMDTNNTNNINKKHSYHSYVNSRYSYWRKWIFGAGSALLFLAIILTQIRGAILGFLAGIFIFSAVLIFSNILSKRKRIFLIACFLSLIVFIGVFWSFRQTSFIQNIDFLKKIANTSITETTAQTRILDWQTAIIGFKDRPLLGAGPENYNYVFNAHYNPEFLKFGGGGFGETWSDKPHNAFLEILSETGIIGSLAYLFIWIAAVFMLYRLFKKGEKILSLTLTSAFIAYLGSIFFAFDSFGSWFGMFLMLGFLASHKIYSLPMGDVPKGQNSTNINKNLKNLFVVLGWICIFGLLWVNLSIWRANLADADALRVFSSNPAQGIDLFKKSLNYVTAYKAEYQFDMAASVIGAIQKNIPLSDLENTVNFALDSIDKAIASHPNNAAYYSDAAKLYNVLGEKGKDPAILNQAEQFGQKSLELSPNRQETLFYLAQTALIRKDIESAIKWTRAAIDAYPEWGKGYWYLGRIYFVAGRYKEAMAEIKKALELDYQSQDKAEKEFIKNLGL